MTPPPRPDFRPAAPTPRDKPMGPLFVFDKRATTNVTYGWTHESYQLFYIRTRIFAFDVHFVSDPEAVERVLVGAADNYPKPELVINILRPFLGEGLLTAEGPLWREQRKVMAPVFTPGSAAEFAPAFAAAARAEAKHWKWGVIDVARASTKTTFDIISQVLFSDDRRLTYDEAALHMRRAMEQIGQPNLFRLLRAEWLNPSPKVWQARTSRNYLVRAIAGFIRDRQNDPAPPSDFMQRILTAFAANHSPEETAQLALDNALTFLGAGHETTANALAWTLYLLSEHPEVQARCRDEAQAAMSVPPEQRAAKLPYLRMVLEESMRLYPPVPRFERRAKSDDVLCGKAIPAGAQISIWPWLIHRHRQLWENPEQFNPENFSPEAKAKHHRFQYLPFGGGPRICIGAAFAMTEALVILSEWLSAWTFSPVPGHTVEIVGDISLRPKDGLPMRVQRV